MKPGHRHDRVAFREIGIRARRAEPSCSPGWACQGEGRISGCDGRPCFDHHGRQLAFAVRDPSQGAGLNMSEPHSE